MKKKNEIRAVNPHRRLEGVSSFLTNKNEMKGINYGLDSDQ